MIGLNYGLLGHVFDQKQIRGVVWRLVRRSVQDALYGQSDALKATVTGKVGTLRRVVGSGCQGVRVDKKCRNSRKKSAESPLFIRNITDVNSSAI